jgi:hypothetical protein
VQKSCSFRPRVVTKVDKSYLEMVIILRMQWLVVFSPEKMEKRAEELALEPRARLARLVLELAEEGPE